MRLPLPSSYLNLFLPYATCHDLRLLLPSCSPLRQPRRRMERAVQQAAGGAPVDEHDVLANVVRARQRPRRCIVRPLHHPAAQAHRLSGHA